MDAEKDRIQCGLLNDVFQYAIWLLHFDMSRNADKCLEDPHVRSEHGPIAITTILGYFLEP